MYQGQEQKEVEPGHFSQKPHQGTFSSPLGIGYLGQGLDGMGEGTAAWLTLRRARGALSQTHLRSTVLAG